VGRTRDVSFERSSPLRAQIEQHFEQILASDAFDLPDGCRRLLRYIVEETLEGRAERLIGPTIGVAVFDRPADFDAHLDPVVRVAAQRLRQSLKLYYLNEGAASKIQITMPIAGYVPTFTGPAINAAREQAQTTDEPATGAAHIRMLSVEMASSQESEEMIGKVVTDEIAVELSRFFSVSIERDGLIATLQPPRDKAHCRRVAQEYALKSSFHVRPGSLRYAGRLTVEETGDVVWNCSVNIDRAEILTLAEQVSAQIADGILAMDISLSGLAIGAHRGS
jgi:TolB-like protein